MRIIVLTGISNTGKTTTLNRLYEMLIDNHAQSDNNRKVLGNPDEHDFSETLTYHNRKVEFFTMGDYPKYLKPAISDASHRGINIFICACSALSPTLSNEFRKHTTSFVSKSVSVIEAQQIIFNNADAITIFNFI